jgi:glutamate racemase
MATIGVFDSGVGGESVVKAINEALPSHEVIYADDKKNIPYGTKTAEELYTLSLPILNTLSIECDVLVIACNTLTTTIIERLRTSLPVPLIGMEPMVKPAASKSKSGVIAVCATPATLRSDRYKWLKDTYAKEITVLEPDCSDWASMIEAKQVDYKKIQDQIKAVCERGADVIVLGCTHYHWIEKETQSIAKKFGAVVIQPEQPVIEQLKKALGQLT